MRAVGWEDDNVEDDDEEEEEEEEGEREKARTWTGSGATQQGAGAVELASFGSPQSSSAASDGEPAAVAVALPSGWQEVLTEDGQKYYHCTLTGKTAWERPKEDAVVLDEEAGLELGGEEFTGTVVNPMVNLTK